MRIIFLSLIPLLFVGSLIGLSLGLAGVIERTAACDIETCPLELRHGDSGGIYTYAPTVRFTVILDEQKNPQSHLHCSPKGVIGTISNIPPVKPPLYAARFEGVHPGACTLSDDDFSATIVIKNAYDAGIK